MPTSEHGSLDNPKKSAYSLEFYDSSWEKEYMEKLENSHEIRKWTIGVRLRSFIGLLLMFLDKNGVLHILN